jgi:hypothetical protein
MGTKKKKEKTGCEDELGMLIHTCNPVLRRQKQEDGEFEVSAGAQYSDKPELHSETLPINKYMNESVNE